MLSHQISSTYAPIGLFDSGVGGLSVYLHLRRLLPNERYIYYADTKNVPYGNRSSEQIGELTREAIDWLAAQGCKLIVIACNSASAHALDTVRNSYPDLPIVGLVPALKPAVYSSQSGRVAVLATQATLDGALLNDVIKNHALPKGVQVSKWFEPKLVPWVEAGMSSEDEAAQHLIQKLHDFASQQIDHIVLGCTHYPFFRGFLQREIDAHNLNITLVDSGSAIADRVQDLLSHHQALLDIAAAQKSNYIQGMHSDITATDKEVEVAPPLAITARYIHDTQYIPLFYPAWQTYHTNGLLGIRLLPGKEPSIPIPNFSHLEFFVTHPDSDLLQLSELINRLTGSVTIPTLSE